MKKTIIFITIFALILFFSIQCNTPSSGGGGSGGDDDDDDSSSSSSQESANGVYAKLYVTRIKTNIILDLTTDSLSAAFSKYYDPCAVDSDLFPTTVQCTDNFIPKVYDLPLNNNRYEYNEPSNFFGFLSLGATYTFNVTPSSEVPALTASINLPSVFPDITYPLNSVPVPDDQALTVSWNGTTVDGKVRIKMFPVDIDNPNIDPESIAFIFTETDDDGSHTFSVSEISELVAQSQYIVLIVERFNNQFITTSGYDSRSFIVGKLDNMILFTLD